jgi:hypothetical protein
MAKLYLNRKEKPDEPLFVGNGDFIFTNTTETMYRIFFSSDETILTNVKTGDCKIAGIHSNYVTLDKIYEIKFHYMSYYFLLQCLWNL